MPWAEGTDLGSYSDKLCKFVAMFVFCFRTLFAYTFDVFVDFGILHGVHILGLDFFVAFQSLVFLSLRFENLTGLNQIEGAEAVVVRLLGCFQ